MSAASSALACLASAAQTRQDSGSEVRTLAVEKRSNEVWQVLGAAKAEFTKYGQVCEKLGRQLDTAKRTVDGRCEHSRASGRGCSRRHKPSPHSRRAG